MQWRQWQDVLADKALCNLPYKIELTKFPILPQPPRLKFVLKSCRLLIPCVK